MRRRRGGPEIGAGVGSAGFILEAEGYPLLRQSPQRQSTPRSPLPFLGLACAVGVSSIYYNQPLLTEMSRTFRVNDGRVGFVAVATQVGYAAGLLLFVPLGDVLERRWLMMRMYGAVAVALLLVAVSPTPPCLIAASALTGILASVTHIALPIAPELASDAQRGRAIGIVMTGLLLGILLARTFAGWVSRIHGWRWVFAIAALMNAAFVPLIWRRMPKLAPKQDLRYGDAMPSLWTLVRTQPVLREASLMGALVFASFSCFWTTLAFLLKSHYGLGAGVAGTFGLVGAAGALIASAGWPALGQARVAVGDLGGDESAGGLVRVVVGTGAIAAEPSAASGLPCGGRDCAGPGGADDAGGKPDANLRSGCDRA